jgi:hypothetical protein
MQNRNNLGTVRLASSRFPPEEGPNLLPGDGCIGGGVGRSQSPLQFLAVPVGQGQGFRCFREAIPKAGDEFKPLGNCQRLKIKLR